MIIAIIGAIILALAVLSVVAVKQGWLSDRDNDGIADVIEDTAEDVEDFVEDVVDDVKEAALQSGAIGCGISGSGPSMFALSNDFNKAKIIAESMQNTFHKHQVKSKYYISDINSEGAIIIK